MQVHTISDIPALFDPYDELMNIQRIAIVDLDLDGTEEAVLWVCGVAGDAGGYLVLHQAEDDVYAYRTNYHTFENLKTDGTFEYSDSVGTKVAVAAVSFTENGLVINDYISATGQEYVMNTYMVDGKNVTEEEYEKAMTSQSEKLDLEWSEFVM